MQSDIYKIVHVSAGTLKSRHRLYLYEHFLAHKAYAPHKSGAFGIVKE